MYVLRGIVISSDLDERFREKYVRRKGDLSKAIARAMELLLKTESDSENERKDVD